MASSEESNCHKTHLRRRAGQSLRESRPTRSIRPRQTGCPSWPPGRPPSSAPMPIGAPSGCSQSVHCAPSRLDRPQTWRRHGLALQLPPPGGCSPSACRTYTETLRNNTQPVDWLWLGDGSLNLVHDVRHERVSKGANRRQLLESRPAALVQPPVCPRDLVHHLGAASWRSASYGRYSCR